MYPYSLKTQILKNRNLIQDQNQTVQDNPSFKQLKADYEDSCEMVAKDLIHLERLVRQAVLYQAVDVFVETTEPLDRMVKAATVRLKVRGIQGVPQKKEPQKDLICEIVAKDLIHLERLVRQAVLY